ncbi:hypothetical protein BD770DRAFT_408283 [Pilaira anomala]|nr:hypothetical protein BD770DRAFT_408283 [Pilaira anomala]
MRRYYVQSLTMTSIQEKRDIYNLKIYTRFDTIMASIHPPAKAPTLQRMTEKKANLKSRKRSRNTEPIHTMKSSGPTKIIPAATYHHSAPPQTKERTISIRKGHQHLRNTIYRTDDRLGINMLLQSHKLPC